MPVAGDVAGVAGSLPNNMEKTDLASIVCLFLFPITTLLAHFALAMLALSQSSNYMKHPDGQTIAPAVSFAQNILS